MANRKSQKAASIATRELLNVFHCISSFMQRHTNMTKQLSSVAFLVIILFIIALTAWLVSTDSFLLPSLKPLQPSPPYNVIMISIDTLRADHLGAYGYSRDTSPNLDRFAKESILFEQAIAQAPITGLSQAAVFTSQYPSAREWPPKDFKILEADVTLAEALKQQGYNTAAFVGNSDDLLAYHGFEQGFDIYSDHPSSSFTSTMPQALEWLEENKNKKFFLYVQGFDVHGPYHQPEPYEHMFDPDYEGILSNHTQFYFDYNKALSNNSILHLIKRINGGVGFEWEGDTIDLGQRDVDHIIAHYDGGVLYTDFLLSQFFNDLKNLGLYQNSIIIIYAGHGETLGEKVNRFDTGIPGLIGHGGVYDELIRVPLIIRHPAYDTQRISTQVQLIDLFPTILDFLKIPMPKELGNQIQGNSVVPLVEGRAPKDFNEYVYGQNEGMQDIVFVRSKQWKLLFREKVDGLVLYDLQNDPEEIHNAATRYPKITEKLKQKLQEWALANLKKKLLE